jgi:hypothetical protein
LRAVFLVPMTNTTPSAQTKLQAWSVLGVAVNARFD